MDAVRLGRVVRALRIRQAMRQEDLGRSAGVSKDLVSRIERGKVDGLRIRILVELARNLGADLVVTLRWRGGDLDRLLDEGHAALMARAAAVLEAAGWSVMPEVTFAHFADRGSIDILAWHASTSTVLVVEVKTELTSLEETLRTHDMKTRIARKVALERSGWQGRTVARMLVLPDSSSARRRVARHGALLARAYPLPGMAARGWLRMPAGTTGLLMFLPFTNTVRGRCGPVSRRRVRAAGPAVPTHDGRTSRPSGPAAAAPTRSLHEPGS